MKERLDRIYEFLLEHRQYNKELQEKYYKSTLLWHNDIESKVFSMLYGAANTQSQPKINKLAEFYRFIYEDLDVLSSFEKLVHRISDKRNGTYLDLFKGLKGKSGWGPKTSALFVKSIYNIHSGKYDPKLRIWADAPSTISTNDQLYLPVDQVIIEIFKRIEDKKWTFSSINKLLNKHYAGEQIVIWDDLWFWGFITQKVENKKRIFVWNQNKYWALECSDKTYTSIAKIEQLSLVFLKHFESNNFT